MVQEFSLLAGDAHRDKKLNQLLALKHAGIAELVNAPLSTWRLSQDALCEVRVAHHASLSGPALQRRDGITVLTACTFELLTLLEEQGWKCEVFVKQPKGKPRPDAYVEDSPKVFWAQHTQKSFQAKYLQALLLVGMHGCSVEHFRKASYYHKLVTGEEPRSRRPRTQKHGFTIVAEDADAAERLEEDNAKKKQTKKRKRLAKGTGSAKKTPTGKKAKTGEMEAMLEETAIAASSSSSSLESLGSELSFGALMSESSSHGPHESAEVPAPPALPLHPPLPPPAPLVMGVFQRWQKFKFVPKFKTGETSVQISWEVECTLGCHKDGKMKCRRVRGFSQHGGPQAVERMLKYWLVCGHKFPTRVDHRDEPDPDPAELPTLQELEALAAAGDLLHLD